MNVLVKIVCKCSFKAYFSCKTSIFKYYYFDHFKWYKRVIQTCDKKYKLEQEEM